MRTANPTPPGRRPALGAFLGAALDPVPAGRTEQEHEPGGYALIRARRRAMATTFEIAIPQGTPHALAAASAGLDLVDDIEDELTVYRDSSEVSRLNAAAAAGPVVVSPRLLSLLETCAGIAADTAGAFDPAVGSMIRTWGFFTRDGRLPTPADRAAAMLASGMRHVVIDAGIRSIKYRVAGLELNFGGVGKGFALDRVAELLRNEFGVRSALLHGGGSSVYGLGCPPGDPRGWAVAMTHPHDESRTLGVVRLKDRGMGTSATTFQFFQYDGRKYGHLLDPRTGRPADGTSSATVTAPTAAAADALSTAAFVLGPAASAAFFRPRPDLRCVLLAADAAAPAAWNFAAGEYAPPGPRMIFPQTLPFLD